ncbi:MAG: signal recognition particle-docking protein FtsY [Akkermansiaceae bacterium]|nr:signal recognition particle-docking protein FtsY [Armatimonadota bacterium]
MLKPGIFKNVFQSLDAMITGRGRIDDELFEQFEEALLAADLSIRSTDKILEQLRQYVRDKRLVEAKDVREGLTQALVSALGNAQDSDLKFSPTAPSLFLMVGVNGVGKTTTLGKLAYQQTQLGKKVLLAAGDTFRAAAAEQLEIWAGRAGADFVRQHERSDPAAVVFDAINKAKNLGSDLILVDTAGRLHNKANLMEELKKIGRVCERELGRKPDEVLLALDATTGQNAVNQAKEFMQSVPLTGIALSKLDGTARGGIVISLRELLGLPIKLVGVGEGIEDLLPFEPDLFVEAMLSVD